MPYMWKLVLWLCLIPHSSTKRLFLHHCHCFTVFTTILHGSFYPFTQLKELFASPAMSSQAQLCSLPTRGFIFNINEDLADSSLTLTCSAAHFTSERKRGRDRVHVWQPTAAWERLTRWCFQPVTHSHIPYMYVSCKPCMVEHRSPCGMMCNIWICTCPITPAGPSWVQLPWRRQLYSPLWDASLATTPLAQRDHINTWA